MAAYCDSSDIDARIPSNVQVTALDDDADGVADSGVLTAIMAAASRRVDASLGRSDELSTPYSAMAVQATIAIACWMIYQRKGNFPEGQKNPYAEEVKMWEKRLMQVADGETSLATPPGSSSFAGNVDQGVDTGDHHFWDETGI